MNHTFSNIVKDKEKIIIELGPGEKKIFNNAIGIDRFKKPSVDFLADLNKGLTFIEDNTVEEIHAYHVLEHVRNLEFLMQEIYRVLKPNGRFCASVPHFSNPYFYSDYTHVNFWGLYSPVYFSKNNIFQRSIPQYYNKINFTLINVELKFSSPFRVRNKIKKLFEIAFNSSCYMQELYEENLTGVFPCHEIKFEMTK